MYIITLIILILLLLFYYLYKSQEVKRIFLKEAERGVISISKDKSIVTKEDIKFLPEIVQKYLLYTGVVGKEKVHNIRLISETDINLGQKSGWSKMKTIECNFFDENPARLAYMTFNIKGIPVVGLDSYINGNGNMLIKPFGILTVADAKGNEMDDKSAAIMLLLIMCTNAPSTLIDKRIRWTVVDKNAVIASFNNKNISVSALLEFNEIGELIYFSTMDKYYSPTGKEYKKLKWSTPVLKYKDICGFKISTYVEAIWHFPEGEYCYGKLNLKEIEYNCQKIS